MYAWDQRRGIRTRTLESSTKLLNGQAELFVNTRFAV